MLFELYERLAQKLGYKDINNALASNLDLFDEHERALILEIIEQKSSEQENKDAR